MCLFAFLFGSREAVANLLQQIREEVLLGKPERYVLALYRLEPRHNDDWKMRAAVTDGASQLETAHARHLEGRDQKVEFLLFEGPQRFGCIRGRNGSVPFRTQDVTRQAAENFIIIDDENFFHGVLLAAADSSLAIAAILAKVRPPSDLMPIETQSPPLTWPVATTFANPHTKFFSITSFTCRAQSFASVPSRSSHCLISGVQRIVKWFCPTAPAMRRCTFASSSSR